MKVSTSWWVDGTDLYDRPRSGGANALKGFAFQEAYSRLRLVWLLTCKNGVVEVRYEGAQDVDIRMSDGSQRFVQAKDYAWGSLSLSTLYDALAGFTRDLICAKANGGTADNLPTFCIVSTSPPVEASAMELFRGVYLKRHAAKVANRVKTGYRNGLDNKAVLACAVEAIDRTSYELVRSESACADLEALASWELVRFGVPVEHVKATIGRISRLLAPRATLQIEDVAGALEGLPKGHPAGENSAFRFLPSRASLADITLAKSQFLVGAPRVWDAIANDLDVERTELGELQRRVSALRHTGGMLTIDGAAGTGKSTLVRRAAWDLHRGGAFVALEVAFPADVCDDDWSALAKLRDTSERPILIVVDDIWRHLDFLEGLDRNVGRNLCVLATSRPGERKSSFTVQLIESRLSLGKIGMTELGALCNLVGTPPALAVKGLRPILEAGQIFVLSLVLQRGSMDEFAEHLVIPLTRESQIHLDAFIDLCVCGMHDHSMPQGLILRRTPDRSSFWKDHRYRGLVFVAGSNGDRLRVGHALVARAVVRAVEKSAVACALSISSDCVPEDGQERRFALRLLSNLAADSQWRAECTAHRSEFVAFARRIQQAAEYADVHRLADLLDLVNASDDAKAVRELATFDRIRSVPDVALAIAMMTPANFSVSFGGVLAFYEQDLTAYARRKFLQTVMSLGTPDQKAQTAAHMEAWLRSQLFPDQETRLLFDLVTYTSKELADRYVHLVAECADSRRLSMETALAAIRLIERTRDGGALLRLESRLLPELGLPTNETDVAGEVALRLGSVGSKVFRGRDKRAIFEVLMSKSATAATVSLKTRLLTCAVHSAPEDQRARLLVAIDELRSRSKAKAVMNCVGLFKRLFPEPSAAAVQQLATR